MNIRFKLKNQFYDVCIVTKNAKGYSKLSNIETVTPNGPMKLTDASDIFLKSHSEINNTAIQQLINENQELKCEKLFEK